MSTRFERLMVTVSMIDKVTGTAGKIAQSIDNVTKRATVGMANIGIGAGGLYAAGRSLEAILGPAIEMDRAVGEIKSLGVANQALKTLEKTALRFSIKYGENARDLVSSSYDIQSAIAGLSGSELGRFTFASGVLAKGTKSDASTITDYMGTMYGIFEQEAAVIGKSRWVEILAGQTASAVQMFKTTGSEMAAAFSSVGAIATSSGVSMNEQMAILGMLQSSMSGSEAGTKYVSFIQGIGKAQKVLGLQFTDSQGRMLPMVDILERIKGRFGSMEQVAKKDLLRKAFGRKEAAALIDLLLEKTKGLEKNINALGRVKGMEKAEEMARAMVDPFQQLNAVSMAIRTSLGRAAMPVLLPLIDVLRSGAEQLYRWTELFPNLTRWVGVAVVTVTALVGAVAALSVVKGIAMFLSIGWGLALAPLKGIWVGLIVLFWRSVAAVTALNMAFLANPITWVILLIAGLAAGIAWLVMNWDTAKAKMLEWAWVVTSTLSRLATAVSDKWNALTAPIVAWFTAVGDAWADLKARFANFDFLNAIGGQVDWLIKKINLIPGIDIEARFSKPDEVLANSPFIDRKQSSDGGTSGIENKVPSGGLLQQISDNSNSRTTTIEKMEVNTSEGVSESFLQNQLIMSGA